MKRLPISDKKIIELYSSGYSQNDIVEQYDVSVFYTRSVLSAAGFNTRGFRTLSPAAVKVIETLVNSDVTYFEIEKVCDISFHAIRDYVKRSNCRERKKDFKNMSSFPRKSEFLEAYRKGDSFCYLVNTLSLGDSEILSVFNCIREDDVAVHRDKLQFQIEKYRAEGLSDAGITQKLNISRSIVRNGFK